MGTDRRTKVKWVQIRDVEDTDRTVGTDQGSGTDKGHTYEYKVSTKRNATFLMIFWG